MAEHIYYKSCESGDCGGSCHMCTLAICKICGLFEGALTTDCPGEQVTMKTSDEIYAGKMDYKDGKGWVEELNPTNISWLYGSYIRFNGTDVQFSIQSNLNHSYFLEIKNNWINKGLDISKLPLKKCERMITFKKEGR